MNECIIKIQNLVHYFFTLRTPQYTHNAIASEEARLTNLQYFCYSEFENLR